MQPPESPVFGTRIASGDQRGPEPERHRPLANAGRPVEQISLRDFFGLQSTTEKAQRCLVPEYAFEPVLPVNHRLHLSHEYIAGRASYPPPVWPGPAPGARRRGPRSSPAPDAPVLRNPTPRAA